MAWNRLIRPKKLYVKRKGIKYFFYTILKYDTNDKIDFKDDLLFSFINEINKINIKVLFFTTANIIKDNKSLNTIYIIIWKDSLLKKDDRIEDIFDNIKNHLNMIFNFRLVPIDENDYRIIFEKVFPFNIS